MYLLFHISVELHCNFGSLPFLGLYTGFPNKASKNYKCKATLLSAAKFHKTFGFRTSRSALNLSKSSSCLLYESIFTAEGHLLDLLNPKPLLIRVEGLGFRA